MFLRSLESLYFFSRALLKFRIADLKRVDTFVQRHIFIKVVDDILERFVYIFYLMLFSVFEIGEYLGFYSLIVIPYKNLHDEIVFTHSVFKLLGRYILAV